MQTNRHPWPLDNLDLIVSTTTTSHTNLQAQHASEKKESSSNTKQMSSWNKRGFKWSVRVWSGRMSEKTTTEMKTRRNNELVRDVWYDIKFIMVYLINFYLFMISGKHICAYKHVKAHHFCIRSSAYAFNECTDECLGFGKTGISVFFRIFLQSSLHFRKFSRFLIFERKK